MEKIYHHRSQLLEMTLVDHIEAIEQKRGTMKGEKEGGRKMVKKEMKTVTGIKRGQEYGWIPDGTENKKDHCISQLQDGCWFDSSFGPLSVSLPTINAGFLQTCSSRHFTPRILSNKNAISSTYGWKKARGCDCFNPEWHTV